MLMSIDNNIEGKNASGCVGCLDTLAAGTSGITGAGIGGYLGTQVPQFLSQYLDELQGHLSEALRASQNHPELYDLLQRYRDLKESFSAIKNSDTPWKLWELIKHYDHQIAQDTLKLYNHGISFDSDTAVYGGILAVLGTTLAVCGYNMAKAIGKGICKIASE